MHLIMPTMPLMLRCRPEVFITNNNRQTFHAHMKLMRPERAARHLPESCTRGRRLTGRRRLRRRRRTTSTMTRRSGRPLFSRRSYPARASGRGCGERAARASEGDDLRATSWSLSTKCENYREWGFRLKNTRRREKGKYKRSL